MTFKMTVYMMFWIFWKDLSMKSLCALFHYIMKVMVSFDGVKSF